MKGTMKDAIDVLLKVTYFTELSPFAPVTFLQCTLALSDTQHFFSSCCIEESMDHTVLERPDYGYCG